MIKKIYFKAGLGESESYNAFREIIKRGDDEGEIDQMRGSDDAIMIFGSDLKGKNICIDCDRETGEFCLFIK